jgi:hypothetical protein
MAEEFSVKLIEAKQPVFYTLPNEPVTIYADTFQTSIRSSDVKIKIGDSIDTSGDEQIVRTAFTVAMSHQTFLKFSDVLAQIAAALRDSYGGNIPEFQGLSADKMAEITASFTQKKAI